MTCSVINADDPTVRAWADLAEIDENLIRRDRTPAQRANLVAQRKAAYEADHLETKQGHPGAGAVRFAKLATLDRFTADTPNAPKSERAVQRDTTRAKASGPDLDPLADTSLDKGAEIDALFGVRIETAEIVALILEPIGGIGVCFAGGAIHGIAGHPPRLGECFPQPPPSRASLLKVSVHRCRQWTSPYLQSRPSALRRANPRP